MRELHLFAGAGGGILGGMLLGHVPVCAVEIDPYCRQVLTERQADGSLPAFPILEDVREFDGKPWRGKVDVVCGGFPCQPWSSAGKQRGTDDPRHLWPEMARVIEEVRPAYVFAENVSLAAFEEPWRDLRRLGYRVPPALCLSAADVGAPHLRKRWWLLASDADRYELRHEPVAEQRGRGASITGHNGAAGQVAHTDGHDGRPRGPGRTAAQGEMRAAARTDAPNPDSDSEPAIAVDAEASGVSRVGNAADTDNAGRAQQRRTIAALEKYQTAECGGWWPAQSGIRRVVDGLAARVDRLRALGNGQVPQCAAEAWRLLMAQEVQA